MPAEYSAFECTAAGTVLYVADKGGSMELLDIRTPDKKVSEVTYTCTDFRVKICWPAMIFAADSNV